MWRFGTDADVAVRDQAVRAGGGSRGELMVPLYSARWALVSPFSVRAGGGGSHEPGGELYSRVPLAQRHRVFLHRADPRNLTLTAVQLALQDHDRSCRNIDFLHVEDLDPAYSHVNYDLLRQKITEFNPDLLCTFRNRFEDRTLGSRLNDSMRYLIEQPTELQCINMVPTVRQGSKDKAVLDQDSVQLDWIEQVLELFDDYITDKYNVPVCVGLFLYEDPAEIAFKNLDASEVSMDDTSTTESSASSLVKTGEPTSGNTSTLTRPPATKRPFNDVSATSTDEIKKDNMDRTVSSVEQWASSLVTTGEPQCVDSRQRSLHTHTMPLLQANSFTATTPSSSSKRLRLDDRKKFAVDIGAGSATFCIEFLEANPDGYALAIDIIEPQVFWSRIPIHLQSRLQYHRAKPDDFLDKRILEKILSTYYPNIIYADVTDIHFSPECQTLSESGNTGARHKHSPKWKHPHRVFNGITFEPTSEKARLDDRVRADVILNCLKPWAEQHPHVRITVENPMHSLFLDMTDVQELLGTASTSEHTQWRVARVDYCQLRDATVDPPTSQKPTVFITYGYEYINAQHLLSRQ